MNLVCVFFMQIQIYLHKKVEIVKLVKRKKIAVHVNLFTNCKFYNFTLLVHFYLVLLH